jgi:hypothetical protein
MERNVNLNKGQLALAEVVDCVKNHLEIAGYNVTTLVDKFGVGVDIKAIKNKENFIIIAVGKNKESAGIIQSKEILFAIGEIVRKMKKRDVWTFYGIAIPKNYFKLLKDFEIDGIHRLDFHLFIVENVWSLYHLDSRATIELIQNLKAFKPESLSNLDIDFKNYDYNI